MNYDLSLDIVLLISPPANLHVAPLYPPFQTTRIRISADEEQLTKIIAIIVAATERETIAMGVGDWQQQQQLQLNRHSL